jgi:hypothetical protein
MDHSTSELTTKNDFTCNEEPVPITCTSFVTAEGNLKIFSCVSPVSVAELIQDVPANAIPSSPASDKLKVDELLTVSSVSFVAAEGNMKILSCVSPVSVAEPIQDVSANAIPSSAKVKPKEIVSLSTLTRRAKAKSVGKSFPYNLNVGDTVEVASQNIWCVATIKSVFIDKLTRYKSGTKSSYSTGVTVSYTGWSSKYDEDVTDQYKVSRRGIHVLSYKAWINLPGLPPWPCTVYDRRPVRNNPDAINFLISEFKLYVQLCGSNANHLKPYSKGFWFDKKCIFPFISSYHEVIASDTFSFNEKIVNHWRQAILKLRLMKIDSNGIKVEDFEFEFNGTFQDRNDLHDWYY